MAAYALTGLVMDGAAAVRGKPIPSTLRAERRQKAREHRQRNPGYLSRVWGNALDSWADASTRRHKRRIAKREAQEPTKSAAWIAKQIEKEEKRADRRRKFADKAGVLWGKARELPEHVRERRREDEAWAENTRYDAERDDNVPAGLAGSTDLDDGQDDAKVLPFRPRTDDTVHEADETPAAPRVYAHDLHYEMADPDLPCIWEGGPDGPIESCDQPRKPGWPMCGEHLALTDAAAVARGDVPFSERIAEQIAGWDAAVQAATTDQPTTGQDINTGIKEDIPMTNASAISGEITGLQSGIELARQMRRYVTDVQNVMENAQGTLSQTSTGLQQVPASLELATASLQSHGMNGPAAAEFAVAQERMDMVAQAVAQAVAALATVADNLGMADTSFSRVESELSSQLGISEQVGAAAARGGVARDTAFYMSN
ncbi:hypothetical protein [Saccharomonospora piscinae]|uniref:hypothetical protein n=1 Tax=Saccharomonospora piscinae TaxID=687388 RepID=UPI001FCA1022|nr:hypothetical protein [Saccharomonospora piscinae]